MSAKLFMIAGIFSIGGIFAEKKLTASGLLGRLSDSSSIIEGIPRSFGTVIILLAFLNFWTIIYGTTVEKARSTYMEEASKNGEKDTEARYSLPNLYVDGNTSPARAFNCVQRSHQQMMESLSQFNTFALLSGLSFPLTTSMMVGLFFAARIVWTNGYAASKGDPKQRYDHPLAIHIWTSLIALCVLAVFSGFNFLAGAFSFL